MLCKKVSVQEWANVDLLVSYSLKTTFEKLLPGYSCKLKYTYILVCFDKISTFCYCVYEI